MDDYADRLSAERAKEARLVRESTAAIDYAREASLVRMWVCTIAATAQDFTRGDIRECLRALGAVCTLWREDYVHPDGWPQRYRIKLTFTGFTSDGAPVTLPAAQANTQRVAYSDKLLPGSNLLSAVHPDADDL